MTLKERFQQWFINDEEDEHYEGMVELVSIEHEKIAEEFAIGFSNWYFEKLTVEDASEWFGFSDKDMLNTYKKEKGL